MNRNYYLLGRSGLRVSRLALGTMNFGTAGFHAAYGKTEAEVEPIFRSYLDAGGNLIDTADFYTAGESERILGRLVARAGVRDRLVLTSKFTNTIDPTDPNASGDGRKHIVRALEVTLRRLDTDYLDWYARARSGTAGCPTCPRVAADLGHSMVQVAINWAATQPGVASVIVGASSAAQLETNLAALDFDILTDARRRLDEASAPRIAPPYSMFTSAYQSRIVSAGLDIGDKPAGYVTPVFNGAATPAVGS